MRPLALAALLAASPPTPAQIVRAWSSDLNANRNEAAARLFAPDARVLQPGVDVVLSSHALAVGFNDALPCAGKIVRLQVRGNRVTATFVLGERPKHHCDGPGLKAATLFVIRDGKIAVWKQVPVPAEPPGA
ncbi:MAG TPA: nuclear transport factor 2 family protein [Gaiellaceae bacterium]|nr:nuclear transport factor 2 family protein [Gaiellaceae bacterium]